MILTDWSPDGKFLTFYTGVLLVVPLDPNVKPLDRKALDWLREDYDAVQGRFSPDGRYMAFLSNEGEKDVSTLQVYVRPFDASKPETHPPETRSKSRITKAVRRAWCSGARTARN